ncbi:MAG: sulfatase-like hydrolase/transferase [bacterium]
MNEKPNILLILTDQHRLDSLGAYGNPICRTPNIDSLAREGVRFDFAFTPTAICTPARASLITGLWPHNHRLLANFERNVGYMTELDESLIPFSRYLRGAGYRCGHVGKWHVGVERGPEFYGFEGPHYPGWAPPIEHPDYLAYLRERGLPRFKVRDEIRGVFPNGQPSNVLGGIYEGPPEGTFEYFLAERTIQRLEEYARDFRESGRPFFLGCNFFGPHLPYYIPEEYANMYAPSLISLPPSVAETFERKPIVQKHYSAHWAFDSFSEEEWRKIIAMNWGYITLIDEQVGRILSALDKLGLAGDTAVFFGADHGAFVGGHRMSDKGPAMYDDIYRIPLISRWPGHFPPGVVRDEFVSLMDLTPTFLELAGVPIPENFDGRSIVPLLEGRNVPDWRCEIFAEFHGHHFPYPQRMIRTWEYKLVVNPPDVNELYDLKNDPFELRNLIGEEDYRGVESDLMRRLYRHLQKTRDNFYHWMTTMFDVGAAVEDASLSSFSSARR